MAVQARRKTERENEKTRQRERRDQAARPDTVDEYGDARTETTGGHPEEMNQMPPDTNPDSPDPVHDEPR